MTHTEVQTFLFDKKHWTHAKAKRWLEEKGRSADLDDTPQTLRYRQIDPKRFTRGSFRTYSVPDEEGILVVVGKLKPHK